MNLVSRPLCQPGAHFRMFMGGVVIDDQVNIEFGRNAVVQPPQKREKLLMPVSRLAFGEHGAGGDVERGKQSSRPVANVVMGDSFDVAEPHGQNRLSSIERLNLALFVNTQHEGVIGRIKIQPCNIANFLNKERIGGELEST